MHSSIRSVYFSKIVFTKSAIVRQLKNLRVALMTYCVVVNCSPVEPISAPGKAPSWAVWRVTHESDTMRFEVIHNLPCSVRKCIVLVQDPLVPSVRSFLSNMCTQNLRDFQIIFVFLGVGAKMLINDLLVVEKGDQLHLACRFLLPHFLLVWALPIFTLLYGDWVVVMHPIFIHCDHFL